MNPFPFPADWAARMRSWWRHDDPDRSIKRFRDLVAYPAFRRNLPGFSGLSWSVPLADLASVDAGPEPTSDEAARIESLQSSIRKDDPFVTRLDLEIADGATAVTTKNRLLLRAYRGLNSSSHVRVALWWPIKTDFRWQTLMHSGTAVQINEAFKTGKVPT